MATKDLINKQGYIETVSGLGTTLAGQASDTSNERELPLLTQRDIVVEVAVTFHASADDGLRVRILEGMASGAIATQPAQGNNAIITLNAGATERATFYFEVRSRYYVIELFNLDSSGARNATGISVKVLEFPEQIETYS